MDNKLVHPIRFHKPQKYILEGILCISGLSLITFGITSFNRTQVVPEPVPQVMSVSDELPEFKLPPKEYSLKETKWIPQTMNNCGPAATAMLLGNFDVKISQAETKAALRTGDDDKNIFMYEIKEYLESKHGLKSRIFINGNKEVIKTLIANGFYVMVEDWMNPGEDIGHVVILRGYDEEGFIGDDSYIGTGVKYPYEIFDNEQWKPFNREFMPVYKSENEKLIQAITFDYWDEQKMYTDAVEASLKEISENPGNTYSWFNLGYDYFYLGEYQKAKEAFEKSKSLGWPGRMLWYLIEPIQNYNKLGEYTKALEYANIALRGNDMYAEVHFEKAKAYKGLGDVENVNKELELVKKYDPGFDTTSL